MNMRSHGGAGSVRPPGGVLLADGHLPLPQPLHSTATPAMRRAVLLIASLVAATLVAATPRRGGEVWSRAQEDAWHAEMGYAREVSQCSLCFSPSLPLSLSLSRSLALSLSVSNALSEALCCCVACAPCD